jgi:phosphoribosylaminoimidazolecarboxamide formyltransferase/IMP cyclohydrolase
MRSVGADSYLLQEWDRHSLAEPDLEIVTKRQPTPEEVRAMLFGWRIVKHVKSNAVLFAHADRTLGIGAGQMSRVDATRLAIWKAGEAGVPMIGSVAASDAFFPFADGVIAASEAGATAVIQPGGSKRDAEVIAAADERNLAMAFTKVRHFRH